MSKKIILSADQSCDLGPVLQEKFGVEYIPTTIILEDKEYIDNETITADDIYRAYWDRKVLPKTTAINMAEYMQKFEPWVQDGYEVIHVALGSALSASYRSAVLAAEELGNVYIIDSCSLSTGFGNIVIEAAKRIAEGKLSARQIQQEVQALTPRSHASFILDTLEFMHAGGRCSTVAALGANLLRLKPMIEVDNRNGGAMRVGKKYRGDLGRVLVSYTKDVLAAYPDIVRDHVFITHSGIDESYIQLVRKTIEETMDFQDIYVTRAACTISCHCGPNTLGVLFMTER